MIFNIIYLVVGSLFNGVASTLKLIPVPSTSQFSDILTTLVSYMAYFRGLIDLDTLGQVIRFLVVFYIFWFIYKLVMKIFSGTPFFKISHPK